jgi:hypothetical protein
MTRQIWLIDMVDKALQAYTFTPASKPKLTNPAEVQDAIRGLKFGNAPDPNGIENRTQKHIPQRAVFFIAAVFSAALLTQYSQQYGRTPTLSLS